MEKKSVTIVIPTIGGERRQAALDKGITSLLDQSIPFDEILIFDNSKNQDVKEKSIYKNDKKIHWCAAQTHLPNALDSWNTAISLARNPYIMIMGDDDFAMPWTHEEIQKGLRKADLVYIPIVDINMEGKLCNKLPKHKEQVVSSDEFRYDIQFKRCRTSISGVTFMKKDFEAAGRFQDALIPLYGLVDFFLWYRIAALQPRVSYSSKYCICRLSIEFAPDWIGGSLLSLTSLNNDFLKHLDLVEKTLITMGISKECLYEGKTGKQNWIDFKIREYYLYLFRHYLKSHPIKVVSLTKEFVQSPISKKAIFKLPMYITNAIVRKVSLKLGNKRI